jgi:cation-transporting ATPase 13A2
VFENKIKPGTFPAIQELKAAHMACRMVTGDNPRTAVSVARECGMINQATTVFYPQFVQGSFVFSWAKLLTLIVIPRLL